MDGYYNGGSVFFMTSELNFYSYIIWNKFRI